MPNLIKRSNKHISLVNSASSVEGVIAWINQYKESDAYDPDDKDLLYKEIKEYGEEKYQNLLNQNAVTIGKAFSSNSYRWKLPLPLCGSVVSELYLDDNEAYELDDGVEGRLPVNKFGPIKIILPAALIANLNVEQIIDEYFGIMYQPFRKQDRFSPGIIEAISSRLRREYMDIDSFIQDGLIQSTMVEGILEDGGLLDVLKDVYGTNETRIWWRSLTPKELDGLREAIGHTSFGELAMELGGKEV